MNKNKKIALLILLLLLVAGGSGLLWHKHTDSLASQKVAQKRTAAGVNLSPPTAAELKATAENKQKLLNQQTPAGSTSTNTPSQSIKSVTPVISYASQSGGTLQVGAYVSGILETNGTCTATLTKGAQTVASKVVAVSDVNSTDCPVMEFQTSALPSTGTWSVTVSYNSTTSSGLSATKDVVVQ